MMDQPNEQRDCPECGMPHDLTPGSLPEQSCARIMRRIQFEDFDAWEHEFESG